MCEKKAGEPWYAYIVRVFKQQPLVAISTVCLVGICYVYKAQQDDSRQYMERMGTFIEKQTEAYVEISKAMKEINVRMEQVERELYREHHNNEQQ